MVEINPGLRVAIISRLLPVLFILILAGCGFGQPNEPMPTRAIVASVVDVISQKTEITAVTIPSAQPSPSNTPPPTPLVIPTNTLPPTATVPPTPTATPSATPTPTHPLMIELMRQQFYPGSELIFEETLASGVNYERYIVSYLSEGNKIYALLTIPWGELPPSGWPVVIFNHGYIPPDEYRTTERYVDYVDGFAHSGYIVFPSDYRGHGNSEGEPGGAYSSPAYTIDVLNGMASVKRLTQADPARIGMWGHSMGGYITLRAMVVSEEIKAGVIWAGVVASYEDLFAYWQRRAESRPTPTPGPTRVRGLWRQTLFDTYGTVEENPTFWNSISSNSYVADLSGPLQLHHGTADTSVPYEYSITLEEQVQAAGLPVELYLYEGDNHNISANFWTAMQRSVQFFDTYLKGNG